MSSLLSSAPSHCVIRLMVGGFLLLLVQASLSAFAPATADLRALARPILLIASACFAAALAGIPDPAKLDWRHRHGR